MRCPFWLVAILLMATWTGSACAQAFFDIDPLATAPGFMPGVGGDYLITDFNTLHVDNTSPSRFRIDVAGGISRMHVSIEDGLGGIVALDQSLFANQSFFSNSDDEAVRAELFGNHVASDSFLRIIHSTPFDLRVTPGLPGDFNHDNTINALDIDLLFVAINVGNMDLLYDVSRDEQVTREDVRFLVEDILDTCFGDANLDGTVNRVDALISGSHHGIPGGLSWAAGDFDGDQRGTLLDAAVLKENFKTPSPVSNGAAVPEPASGLLLAIGVVALFAAAVRRYHRRARAGIHSSSLDPRS